MRWDLIKKIWKHSTTVLLGVIILILLVPSWRVSFQGWFQGLFLSDLEFEINEERPLPESVNTWQLLDAGGKSNAFATFRDKPIVLSFWATWCPPCRAELPHLSDLKDRFERSIHFLAVSDEPDQKIVDSGLREDYDFLFSTPAFPTFFKVNAYPTLYIIDRNGNLIFRHEGAGGLDNEKNISFLNQLVENQ